jgi:hypothetical protein
MIIPECRRILHHQIDQNAELAYSCVEHRAGCNPAVVLAELHIRADFRLKQDEVQWPLCLSG